MARGPLHHLLASEHGSTPTLAVVNRKPPHQSSALKTPTLSPSAQASGIRIVAAAVDSLIRKLSLRMSDITLQLAPAPSPGVAQRGASGAALHIRELTFRDATALEADVTGGAPDLPAPLIAPITVNSMLPDAALWCGLVND